MKPGKLNILWLDPGGTTGWALYTCDLMSMGEGTPWEHHNVKWNSGHLGPEQHHCQLWSLIGACHTDNYILGYESFEFRQGKQRAKIVLDSKEYIGLCKLYACLTNPTVPVELISQTAATGKGFWSDEKLKQVGLFTPAMRHAMDATRHLLHYLTFGPFQRREWFQLLKEDGETRS